MFLKTTFQDNYCGANYAFLNKNTIQSNEWKKDEFFENVKLMNHYFGQDSRRFEKMGYFGMAWYLIKNFWNRNNEKYWNNIDYSKYWK